MLDKDTFINYMNEIIDQYDTVEELYESIDKIFGVGDGIISQVMSVSLPVKILADVMNDTGGWIEYYIYESDCGHSTGEVFIDDEEIKLETPEDLWNILTT